MDCTCLYQGVPWLWQKGGSWPSLKKHIWHTFDAVITCCKALIVVNEENLLERLREKLSVAWSYCGTCELQQNQSMSKQTAAYCNKNISDQCGSQRDPVNQGWAVSYTWRLNGPIVERPWARNFCGSKAVKHTLRMCVQMHMHAQNKQCTCLALPSATNL
jgi:hypothetical protein